MPVHSLDGYLNLKVAIFGADLQALHQSRADNSLERELRSWLASDLLLLEDLALVVPPVHSRKDLLWPR